MEHLQFHPDDILIGLSVAVFLSHQDQDNVLLVQQAAPEKEFKWGPVAGKVKAGEAIWEALRREIAEEIGNKCNIKLVDLIDIHVPPKPQGQLKVGFSFRGVIRSGEPMIVRPNEIQDIRFYKKGPSLELIDQHMIYKPEYSARTLQLFWQAESYPLAVADEFLALILPRY